MSAYLVLLLAVLSRILPHAFHSTSVGFTAVGGSLLFFGARTGRNKALWQIVFAVLALVATDYYLTVYAYGFPFHASAYVTTWIWYAAICLLGAGLLADKVTGLRVAAGVFASATSFFLLSNFMVWVGGGLYAKTAAGLGACYIAAIPFYANDVMSTVITVGALFGLPALARNIAETIRSAQDSGSPLA